MTTTIARILLGLPFLVFGLQGFLHFPPEPEGAPERAEAFLTAMNETGYLWPLVKAVEVLAGALLVSGFFVPLALALLAPILVNIVLYHAYLDPGPGALLAVALLALELYLVWCYRVNFRTILRARVEPTRPR